MDLKQNKNLEQQIKLIHIKVFALDTLNRQDEKFIVWWCIFCKCFTIHVAQVYQCSNCLYRSDAKHISEIYLRVNTWESERIPWTYFPLFMTESAELYEHLEICMHLKSYIHLGDALT